MPETHAAWLLLALAFASGAGLAALACWGLTRRAGPRQTADLREREERLVPFLETFPGAVFIADAGGALLYANAEMRKLAAGNGTEQKHPEGGSTQGGGQTVRHDAREVLRRGSMRMTMSVSAPDGRPRTYDTLEFAIRRGDAPPLVGGIVLDVTEARQAEKERQQLEERLRQAQTAEEIRFLTGRVGHGFRNLLGIIPGYCELALDGLPADSQSRANIEQIRTQTERALLLLKQMLTPEQDHCPEPPGTGVNDWVSEAGARLASTLPAGITVESRLAANAGAAEADAGCPARSAPGTGQTILVVEDEESVRRFVRNSLVQAGYKVLDAGDGPEALARAAGHPGIIDLLLTDVVMPGMNGKELYGRLASLRPGLPVLYMSGYTQDVIARHGILEPETHFLSKPFSVPDLTGKVREVLMAS